MSSRAGLPGTNKDWRVWVDDTLILEGTVTDADGTVVDLTDTSQRLLVKEKASDADAAAVATATVAVVSAAGGTFTATLDRSQLDAGREYFYSLKVEFGATYSTVLLRGAQLTVLWGNLPADQDVTRDVTP